MLDSGINFKKTYIFLITQPIQMTRVVLKNIYKFEILTTRIRGMEVEKMLKIHIFTSNRANSFF